MSTRNWVILGLVFWILSIVLAFGLGQMSIEGGEVAPIIIEKAR
jgi:hypothetical protein